jgi:hypothetical protein
MKNLLLFFLVFEANVCLSQNMVPNSSFEDTINCPNSTGVIYASHWFIAERIPSYFNACCSIANNCSVPTNIYTTRNAASGYAYCGMVNYVNWQSNVRDKIGVELIDTLLAGKRYRLSFKATSVTAWRNTLTNGSCNNLGFLFSKIKYDASHPIPTNNIYHFKADSIIRDTIGWEYIEGSFIADSAYTYLYIGNFMTDSVTDTLRYFTNQLNPLALRVYNFIDDIYVAYDSTQDVGFSTNSTVDFSIYPIPTSDLINIATNNLQIEQIEIFNAIGSKEKEVFHPPVQAVLKLDIADLTSGIYLIKLKTKSAIISKKLKIIH